MQVFPRSEWTSQLPVGSPGADETDDLPNFTAGAVKGIAVHYNGGSYPLLNRDPTAHFESLRSRDVDRKGYSDIMYNLGVAPRVRGVWELRGLVNKGAANGNSAVNAEYVSVYCPLAVGEKPTDIMLASLKDARDLVLTKYPKATAIVGHYEIRPRPTSCPGPILAEIIKDPKFWEKPKPAPVPTFVCPLPEMSLKEGDAGIHVFSLISQLSFWGYYRLRNDGHYGPACRHAVRELQVDLKAEGKYNRAIDGQFGPYTRKGWCVVLYNLWRMANGH